MKPGSLFIFGTKYFLSIDNLKYLINCSSNTCGVLSTSLCKVRLTAATTLHLTGSLTYNLTGVQALLNKVGADRDCQLWFLIVYTTHNNKQVLGLFLTQHEHDILDCCRSQWKHCADITHAVELLDILEQVGLYHCSLLLCI